jgi:hypothetical protein
VTFCISQQLNLDVSSVLDQSLEVYGSITEGSPCFSTRCGDGGLQLRAGVYGTDPYAAATCRSFEQEGITYLVCGFQELTII